MYIDKIRLLRKLDVHLYLPDACDCAHYIELEQYFWGWWRSYLGYVKKIKNTAYIHILFLRVGITKIWKTFYIFTELFMANKSMIIFNNKIVLSWWYKLTQILKHSYNMFYNNEHFFYNNWFILVCCKKTKDDEHVVIFVMKCSIKI